MSCTTLEDCRSLEFGHIVILFHRFSRLVSSRLLSPVLISSRLILSRLLIFYRCLLFRTTCVPPLLPSLLLPPTCSRCACSAQDGSAYMRPLKELMNEVRTAAPMMPIDSSPSEIVFFCLSECFILCFCLLVNPVSQLGNLRALTSVAETRYDLEIFDRDHGMPDELDVASLNLSSCLRSHNLCLIPYHTFTSGAEHSPVAFLIDHHRGDM
eukprot:754745-Hanusia_phi.AAC.3